MLFQYISQLNLNVKQVKNNFEKIIILHLNKMHIKKFKTLYQRLLNPLLEFKYKNFTYSVILILIWSLIKKKKKKKCVTITRHVSLLNFLLKSYYKKMFLINAQRDVHRYIFIYTNFSPVFEACLPLNHSLTTVNWRACEFSALIQHNG